MPWQFPPCAVAIENIDGPDNGNGARDAAELLKKLLDAGLSRFEPKPLQALAEAERKAAS
jgi:hypothetical protein